MSQPPATLTYDEYEKLLNQLSIPSGQSRTNCKSIRNFLMTLLMLEAGLRVGEVVNLKIRDLYFQNEPVNTLRIRKEITKGDSERLLPLTDRICSAIAKMKRTWWTQALVPTFGFAFFTKDPHKPLTTRQAERILSSAGTASIGRPVRPHMLRHTFASRLMRQVNASVVQQLLGHKSLTSTQIYCHPNGDDLRNAINKL